MPQSNGGFVPAPSVGGSSSPGYEIGYDQITAPVNITATTQASGTLLVQASAYTFDGAAVIAEFFAPQIKDAAGTADSFVVISLYEGASAIAAIADVELNANSSATPFQVGVTVTGKLRFTPTAGTHTYKVTAYGPAGTAVCNAGASGTGFAPAYLRFTKV